MEQNNFEELEAVEVEEAVNTEPQLKEYEKLLIAEANREDYEKAVNLVKFGCFEQKQLQEVDFSVLEKIPAEKKFKGLYSLYRNLETMEMVFVCPLVENNKGDVEENKDMKPYAYDCLIVEAVDNETYQMVCKAAKNNISNFTTVLYKGSFIAYAVLLAITCYTFIFNLISYYAQGLTTALALALFYSATFVAAAVISVPLLVLISIKYKKYKEQ